MKMEMVTNVEANVSMKSQNLLSIRTSNQNYNSPIAQPLHKHLYISDMVNTRTKNANSHPGKPDAPRPKRPNGSVAADKTEAAAKKATEVKKVTAAQARVAKFEAKMRSDQESERLTAADPVVSKKPKLLTAKAKVVAALENKNAQAAKAREMEPELEFDLDELIDVDINHNKKLVSIKSVDNATLTAAI